MPLSQFVDRSTPPLEQDLVRALGETHPLWEALRADLAREVAAVTEEWVFFSQKLGWNLCLSAAGEVLLTLTPRQGYFIAGLAFEESRLEDLRCACLPSVVVQAIEAARPEQNRRTFQIQVHTPEDLDCIHNLLAIREEGLQDV